MKKLSHSINVEMVIPFGWDCKLPNKYVFNDSSMNVSYSYDKVSNKIFCNVSRTMNAAPVFNIKKFRGLYLIFKSNTN